MKFRTGIIGCGRIGYGFDADPRRKTISSHTGAYSVTAETDLVAVCDLDKKKLKECSDRWEIPSMYTDYKEMLRRESLDILSLCTPNFTHFEMANEAAKANVKAIFCEKPLADSLDNADRIIRICREKDIVLLVNHQRRFDKFHREVRDYIHDHHLGDIQQVSFYYTAGIANTGSHMFDLLRFFFGEMAWIRATYSRNKSSDPRDPNIDGVLKSRSGIFCTVQACDASFFTLFEMDCIGTGGRLKITQSGFGMEFYQLAKNQFYSGYNQLSEASCPICPDTPRDYMLDGVRHLTDCLKTGREPECSGEDGRASLELVSAFIRSAKLDDKKIALPLGYNGIQIPSR